MANFGKTIGKTLHHAYSIEGDNNTVLRELLEFLESELAVNTKNNPDFRLEKFETFGIEDARKLTELQNNKSWDDSKKIFILEADSMTLESQNSLLKIFEEPTENSHFFIIGACVKNLIPTLNSRLMKITAGAESKTEETEKLAEKFLKADLKERMETVKKLSDEIKAGKKSKNDAVELIKSVEAAIYEKSELAKDKKVGSALAGLEMCQNYLNDRSAGVKMLLEYAAIITPRGK